MAQVRSNKLFSGSKAKRLALDTTNLDASDSFREDTGDEYEWSGSSWVSVTSGGNAHVAVYKTPSVQIEHQSLGEILTPVAAFLTDKGSVLSIQMEVKVNTLDQFEIRYKYSADGDYITRVSAALDFTTPNTPVIDASGSWLTASVANTHWLKLDVAGVYAVQLWAASGNVAGSEVVFNGGVE